MEDLAIDLLSVQRLRHIPRVFERSLLTTEEEKDSNVIGPLKPIFASATAEVAAIVKRTLLFLNLFPLFERGLASRLIQEVRGPTTLKQGVFYARLKGNNQITSLAQLSNPQLLVEDLVWRLNN